MASANPMYCRPQKKVPCAINTMTPRERCSQICSVLRVSSPAAQTMIRIGMRPKKFRKNTTWLIG